MPPRTAGAPRIDAIEIAAGADSRVNPAVLQRYPDQRIGQQADTGQLNRDLLLSCGDDFYDQVEHTLVNRNGRNVMRVMPI